MKIEFTDFMLNCIRVLVLFNSINSKHNVKMTENRVALYDFYLRFPYTMSSEKNMKSKIKKNLDEHYAFYHWQPDVIMYRTTLYYLISKGLVECIQDDKDKFYQITEIGISVVSEIENGYKSTLANLCEDIVPQISKISDARVEKLIREKTNILMRNGWIEDEI